jgi:hypothetical protein
MPPIVTTKHVRAIHTPTGTIIIRCAGGGFWVFLMVPAMLDRYIEIAQSTT